MPANVQAAACIHLFFEGYFVVNHKTLAGGQTLFAQLWKEYSLSDSRYLTSDAFLISMEAVTAVCHPRNLTYMADMTFALGTHVDKSHFSSPGARWPSSSRTASQPSTPPATP